MYFISNFRTQGFYNDMFVVVMLLSKTKHCAKKLYIANRWIKKVKIINNKNQTTFLCCIVIGRIDCPLN